MTHVMTGVSHDMIPCHVDVLKHTIGISDAEHVGCVLPERVFHARGDGRRGESADVCERESGDDGRGGRGG